MQAEINVGLLGHVDHGKTTLTSALTGKWTDTHSEEIKRGISIRLGYADTYIYYCSKCKKITIEKKCPECGKMKLNRLIGSGAGVIFKGSGFYETDYRSDNYKQGQKNAKAAPKKTDKSKDTKKKTDTKPKTESTKANKKTENSN